MRYRESRLFVRSLKGLVGLSRKQAVKEAVDKLIECLENQQPPASGLGLKKLKASCWEIRSSLYDRILFSWKGDLISFLLVGNHDDIHRFLKSF